MNDRDCHCHNMPIEYSAGDHRVGVPQMCVRIKDAFRQHRIDKAGDEETLTQKDGYQHRANEN